MKKARRNIIIIATIILLAVILSKHYQKPSEPIETDWQESYRQALIEENIEGKYTAETDYYDYSSSDVKNAINEVINKSNSSKEAVQLTLRYVYDNVEYISGESDFACLGGKASNVLKEGRGQCDTQSMAVIAMLRGMGIAARPVGGCAYMAMFALVVDGPILEPIKIDVEKGTASRGGALHAWTEAWIPDEGWVPLEPTRGMFQSELKGYNFNVEMYPENDDKYHLCLSSNITYAGWCSKR